MKITILAAKAPIFSGSKTMFGIAARGGGRNAFTAISFVDGASLSAKGLLHEGLVSAA